MRLACLLALLALVVLAVLCLHPDGRTAVAFSFVGIPALAVALAFYGLSHLRGGTHSSGT